MTSQADSGAETGSSDVWTDNEQSAPSSGVAILLKDYDLKARDQRNQHMMQAWVLLGIFAIIMVTLVLSIVAVGIDWITQDFAQQILSLVLTAALSGLGGAVAWAFRGVASTSQDSNRR